MSTSGLGNFLEKQIQRRRTQEEYLKSIGNDDGYEEFESLSRDIQPKKKAKANINHGKRLAIKDMEKHKGVNGEILKVLESRAHSAIARWMYDTGIAFDAVSYDSFQEMIHEIGKHGPGLEGPSFHDLTSSLLKKEVKQVKNIMEDHKEEWKKYGCSIMLDSWKDKRERTLVNFLVHCPKGSMFVKSVDASEYSKTGDKMFELLSNFVEEIGSENVVQVVTDNASNMKLAGRLLMTKYPNLYWTPCATHCLGLILEDIFKEEDMHPTFMKAMKLNNYIYSRLDLVNLMRKFTKLESVRPAATHFATVFLMLSRINTMKRGLRAMFLSDTWRSSKWAKERRGIQVSQIVLSTVFWQGADKALKIVSPLVKVLQLVDREKKPPMGYIYQAMNKAKQAIAQSFEDDEEKYRRYFDIIDKRWEDQLHQPLNAAGCYLNPEFFYSNPDIKSDKDITMGFYKCLERLVSDTSIQDKISDELMSYKNEKGLFGLAMAKRQRTTRPPADWWRSYVAGAPNLQKIAIKILRLTCSAFGCERNRWFLEHVHSKKRNRLAQAKMNDMVFVKYNRALRQRYENDTIDPISLDDIDDSNECLVEKDDGMGGTSDEEMFDDGLAWGHISKAYGAEEPAYITREQPSTSKAPSGGACKHKGKAKVGVSSTFSTRTFNLVEEEEEEAAAAAEEEEEECVPAENGDEDSDLDSSEDEGDI